MDMEAVNREVKREFEEEWAGTNVENLLYCQPIPACERRICLLRKISP